MQREQGEALRAYLTHVARVAASAGGPKRATYSSLEDYVLDRGRSYQSATPDEGALVEVLREADRLDPQPQRCFYNAQLLVGFCDDDRIRYCEGYAQGDAVIPVYHGWIVIGDAVVDLTWRPMAVEWRERRSGERYADRVVGTLPPGWAYYGVEFDAETVRRHVSKRSLSCPIIDDWRDGWPELHKPRANTEYPQPLSVGDESCVSG